MTEKTYSLAEACDIIRGSHEPADLEWVSKRLRSGEWPSYKPGRKRRLTEEHVRVALQRLERKSSFAVPEIPLSGMTPTSRRRLSA